MKLIAGPCVVEDYEILDKTAQYLCSAIEGKKIDFYFKSSAIKDNRTKIEKYQGVGMHEGISNLIDIGRKYDVKITTDFHTEIDIMRYGSYVDLIQIPAYLAQQTSLIEAASKIHKPIHIKKPQFLGPIEAAQPYNKLMDLGFDEQVFLTDRGTMFGYNMTMMDPRHIPLLKSHGPKVLVDVTHPNKNYPTGNDIDYKFFNALILARSAIVSGADGIFLETHPDCTSAKCDAGTMISAQDIEEFVQDIYSLWKYINNGD